MNLVCNHSDRDMKEAAERAANSVCLFRVDGQCLTSAKFGMRELGCRQKGTRSLLAEEQGVLLTVRTEEGHKFSQTRARMVKGLEL